MWHQGGGELTGQEQDKEAPDPGSHNDSGVKESRDDRDLGSSSLGLKKKAHLGEKGGVPAQCCVPGAGDAGRLSEK